MVTIYTWRKLQINRDPSSTFDLRWDWKGWDHAANDRNHILEAARLWRMVYLKTTIEPIIEALTKKSLKDCHADLQRLAELWKEEFVRVLRLPRVLHARAFPKEGHGNKSTSVMTLVTREGLVFIAREVGNGLRSLSTFFFAETLVHGLSLFPEMFERNAVEHYADLYSRCSHGRLPSRNNKKHFFVRRYEIDRQIHFYDAVRWGFKSNETGAPWIGFDEPIVPDAPVGVVDHPPAARSQEMDVE